LQENRVEFFRSVISHIWKAPSEFPDPANRKKRILEELPIAPPPKPKEKTRAEIKEELRKDHLLLNLLKVQLQPIMDQIKKYKKFRQPVIPDQQVHYLFLEADPSYVRPDLAPGQVRPFEIAKDKDGQDGLRETLTGKFYYNLDLQTIEERLSNGYYARPRDFYNDVVSLAKDAKNIGDKERVLKANELVTNVEVDVAEAESRLAQVNWEELYQRQLRRARDAAEKERKRKAAQSMVGLISESQEQGPVRIGEPVPHTTTARFRLMSPTLPAAARAAAHQAALSNGNSVPSHSNGDDVQMGGVDDEPTQAFSHHNASWDTAEAENSASRLQGMKPPPPVWPPRQEPSGTAETSARATAGETQLTQTSAVTAVPQGMSPSAIINDASTTKTSDPSTHRSSGNLGSTQATNGVHSEHNADGSPVPDTQPMGEANSSQAPSSGEQWTHSQAHGIARGILMPGSGQTSPTSSQLPPGYKSSSRGYGGNAGPASVANLLNDDSSVVSESVRGSGSTSEPSSQPTIFPIEIQRRNQLQEIAERTEGCTIEQLEQIHRELMDEIWKTRHEHNRQLVLSRISRAFNYVIAEIEQLQGIFPRGAEAAETLAMERGFKSAPALAIQR
jgi:ATPase family AAA domain-containing protein 2